MTQPSTTTQGQPPAALVAAVWALLTALFSRILFGFSEAGPASNVLLPIFPFITGAAGFFAARTALRALRATKAAGHEPRVRGLLVALSSLALLIDLLVVGFAVIVGLLILHGPIVQ